MSFIEELPQSKIALRLFGRRLGLYERRSRAAT